MRKILAVAALCTAFLAAPAIADDSDVLSFTGLHAGLGVQWYKQEGAVVEGVNENSVPPNFAPGLNCNGFLGFLCSDEAFRENGSDQTGWAVTGSVLALQQMGGLVVGVEAGAEYSDDIKGGFGMLRAGLAMANVMPYVHGGLGYEIAEAAAGGFSTEDGRVTGRLGGGIMVMLNPDFSLDLAYTYVSAGDVRERFVNGEELVGGDQRHVIGLTGRIKLN